ncbi:hypothetical protein [Nocardioides alcanivorans]|uniref:hypothetical protein n=1 Tax=Nocardioides alcanivorans TaxID=2897352 RepID=UPI001F31EAC9|nr:hypothetical protein [Nocardioides alcanivorans]
MINATDWTTAAITVAWELAPDVATDPRRRRMTRAGIAVAGAATLAWVGRGDLAEARQELRQAQERHHRLEHARSEAEVDAVLWRRWRPTRRRGRTADRDCRSRRGRGRPGRRDRTAPLDPAAGWPRAPGCHGFPGALARGALALAAGAVAHARSRSGRPPQPGVSDHRHMAPRPCLLCQLSSSGPFGTICVGFTSVCTT